MGLDSAGRVEWQRAVARLDRDTRAQAAIMAHRWGWHSRAIATGSANGLIDDLDIRFPAPYLDLYQSLSPRANIAISWAYGITRSESLFMRDVSSPAGAIGLMQLMPDTQSEVAVSNPFDPAQNIRGGTAYLARLLDEFSDDLELAAAAYNAGPSAVYRHGGIPPFEETREYVRRIKILHRRYTQVL